MPNAGSPRRFVFISSNLTTWGGSESLWATTAAALAEEGHHVSAYKLNIDESEADIRRLRDLGCRVRDFGNLPLVPRKTYTRMASLSAPLHAWYRVARTALVAAFSRADLIVISQGGNLDGVQFAHLCRTMKKPYALIAQKATDMYWPADVIRARMREVYTSARASFFVSEHNRRLTEEQVGASLPNASVVRNPFLVDWEQRHDWPDERDGLRLACVGRLYPSEKGQDLLLRVLARDRWRTRNLSVRFFGAGDQREALEGMATHYGLERVTFGGFTRDVASIWDEHHGLVLPSRCEGLPLVLVEAMLSGRVPIVTDVGGSREVLDDGTTGFLAAAPTEDSLDEAMDRAWQRRHEWKSIGARAAESIRTLVPRDPARSLAEKLLGLTAELQANAASSDDARSLESGVPARGHLAPFAPEPTTSGDRECPGECA